MNPITRGEIFLAYAAGTYEGDLPTPQTRAEHFLKDIGDRLDGIDEEMKNIEPVSPEDVNSAIADYIDEHGTVNASSFIVEKGDTAYSVKFAVPDGKPALIYDEIEQEE